MIAFRHFSVRVFCDYDCAIYEHAEAKQHAKHHHEVEGITQQVDENERKQKGNRNAQTNDQTAAKAHCGDHYDHHQTKRGKDVALQFGHL